MTKNMRFTGIMPALVTPVADNGALLENTVRRLVDWQLSRGVSGFYVCGHTGEGPALPEETRRRMAEVTVRHVAGRGHVICHVGACDANSSLRLARHACEAGCDAVASLPPTGYYDYSEDEVYAYYSRLGEASPLPLIVYANSMFKQTDIAPFVRRLMEIPAAAGVKFTRNNFYEMRNIIELCDGVNMINGPDEMLINGLTAGAQGGIGSTYNIMPGRFVKLYEAFAAGDFETARQTQFEINRVIRVILKYGVIRCVKRTLCEMGFDVGGPVFPGRRIDSDEAKSLQKDMEEAGFSYEIERDSSGIIN